MPIRPLTQVLRSVLGAGLFTLSLSNGLAATSAAQETIKIGEFASLTGKEAVFGQNAHKGTLLAIEEVNAAGGVLGRQLELITEDNQSKAGESATVVKKLISRDKVVAVLGEIVSGRTLEAAPIAQQAKIPLISPGATNVAVTAKGNYIFRVCFIDDFQGTVMAKFAKDSLKLKQVAILSSVSSAQAVGLAKYFKEGFTAAGGTIAIDQKYGEGDKDFRAQLTAIKSAGADGVFVPGYYAEAALICKQARELGAHRADVRRRRLGIPRAHPDRRRRRRGHLLLDPLLRGQPVCRRRFLQRPLQKALGHRLQRPLRPRL